MKIRTDYIIILADKEMSDYKPLKCTYTFKLVRGDSYKWEIEIFFFNHGVGELEPLSSSSQTVARSCKVPFGFIESVTHLSTERLGVSNKTGQRVALEFTKLSPMLDVNDSKLKRTLLHFKSISCAHVVGMLNKLIGEFHSDSLKIDSSQSYINDSNVQMELVVESTRKRMELFESSSESGYESNNLSKRSRSLVIESQTVSILNETVEYRTEDSEEDIHSSPLLTCASPSMVQSTPIKDMEKSIIRDLQNVGESQVLDESHNKSVNLDTGKILDEIDKESSKSDHDSLMSQIKEIIGEVELKALQFENIVVPKEVSLDLSKVQKLREYLVNTPDKTKSSLIGVIALEDEGNGQIDKYECWVNAELFTALSHLSLEGEIDNNRVLAVVHMIKDNDVDIKVLGNFLLANSLDFDTKFSDKMMYQDLLRFSIRLIREENTEEVKKFVRESLKRFSKGYRNSALLLQLATLSESFLKVLEKFIDLYEVGSINGMQLSARKRCGINRKDKRKSDHRIEVPIDIFRNLLGCESTDREILVRNLVNCSITLSEFKSKIALSAGLREVKAVVASVAEKSFESLKKSFPTQLNDEKLTEYVGAKSHPKTGPNLQYSKLCQLIKDLVEIPTKNTDSVLAGSLMFLESETIGLVESFKKIKESDIIFIEAREDCQMLDKYGYVIREQVLSNRGIVVYLSLIHI